MSDDFTVLPGLTGGGSWSPEARGDQAIMNICNAALEDGRARDVGMYMFVPDTLLEKARADGWTGQPFGEITRPDGRVVYLFHQVMEN